MGSPDSDLDILSTDALASSAEYPRFAMILGKLPMVSTRLIAASIDPVTSDIALEKPAAAAPATAPVRTLPHAFPLLLTTDSTSDPPSALEMSFLTPGMRTMTET
ncbi:hypothetical protein NS234_04890 [Microbacterium oxydans]|nr:hypothetical protein NS234_04890 [Microbacterium oxydans]